MQRLTARVRNLSALEATCLASGLPWKTHVNLAVASGTARRRRSRVRIEDGYGEPVQTGPAAGHPSSGSPGVSAEQGTPADGALRAAELLHEARQHEREGRLPKAMDCYVAAIAEAAWSGAWVAQAISLRRLGMLHYHRNEPAAARESCRTSYDVALRAGDSALAAEAMSALGSFELECGDLVAARDTYREALALGGHSSELRARIEQSLSILADVQGHFVGALKNHRRSLEAYQASTNARDGTIADPDSDMVSAGRGA